MFVHLHLHSEYSIVDGLIRINDLVDRVAALGMPAIAVTDQSALFSMVKFYRAAQARGIKPIIGADLWLAGDAAKRSRIVALCQNAAGYRNLTEVITRSYTEGQVQGVPHVQQEWLFARSEGILLLSGAGGGEFGQLLAGGSKAAAKRRLRRWLDHFPNRYHLELQRTGRSGEAEYIERALDLAAACQAPVVATNDVCFLHPEDYEAHEARFCIHAGRALADPRRPKPYSQQQYLRSTEEMEALWADVPEAIENSRMIAERCSLELTLDRYHLPDFPVPPGTVAEDYLRSQAETGLRQRLAVISGADAASGGPKHEGYAERLMLEIGVITKMGFAGYFLIVADFIRWAKECGIPVGPGRGSGAGSLTAYALGITDLDPIQYDLLFERFLNPERVSMPDFDVDFCMDRRDEVIDYVAERYGRDRVSQIITYGSMAARAVVRDVGRVLGYPYGFVDQIAKLIPFDLNMTLERALSEEPAFRERYEAEEEAHTLIDLAKKLEGLVRNAGKHAGGVVIAPAPLIDFMPLYCEQGSTARVTQFDMGDVEAMGLVKFDFLGLRTLTIIAWAVRDINASRALQGDPMLDLTRIPLDGAKTFELIQRGETAAVFQLESRGMKDLVKRLRPDTFDDLVALVALFRPGPLQSGMVDDFIDRKQGRAAVRYPHPSIEPILKPTYGVILYQEQVMQIAQVLAGYSLGAADLLRRAMGKKKPEEMAKQRAVFIGGAVERKVAPAVAGAIFDLMEKFAGYGFNKSHSAAYALIAYQTAWLKAHYPAAFMAAVLSADMDNTDKVVALIDECRRLGLGILSPHINTSAYGFTVASDASIRYGLGAVKGAGRMAIEAMIAVRDSGGAFRDLFDLCLRVDARKANRRVLEALIQAGAMDGLGPDRGWLLATLAPAMQTAGQSVKDRASGQHDLFGFSTEAAAETLGQGDPKALRWSDDQRLAGERETLGLYLSGHPIDRYEDELNGLVSCRLRDLRPGTRRIGGLVLALRHTDRGRGRIAIATLDDHSARIEVVVYPETLKRYAAVLVKDRVLIAEGACRVDEVTDAHTLVAERLLDLPQARAAYAKGLVVSTDAARIANEGITELQRLLETHRNGRCPVFIEYRGEGASGRLRLGDAWRVDLSDALLEKLRALFEGGQVTIDYGLEASAASP
ncbi:MAG: DNA polymerase III subunit alpha [Pseudomonadota bacterium]|nr:DNA polymerase III subunit alpha [Pseudomonadota bacterium]